MVGFSSVKNKIDGHKNNSGFGILTPSRAGPYLNLFFLLENPFSVVTCVMERVYSPNVVVLYGEIWPGEWLVLYIYIYVYKQFCSQW